MNTKHLPPNAAALIESMRDIGYSLATALADIIDNSITAGAKSVRILADTTSTSLSIAIADDGTGMTEQTLIEAMRPGSKNPLQARSENDLGRFGLGLKTASFSQCRRLTVLTRKESQFAAARWDLDLVAQRNDWVVDLPDVRELGEWKGELETDGTVVIWEKLDRLHGTAAAVVKQIDDATRHLELVFHRYLSPERGRGRISISINGRKLEALNPFASSHSATQAGPIERLPIGDRYVELQAFTLPHHSKIDSRLWDKLAGLEGFVKNQGFYVYRNDRLIIHGTWFGLARHAELTKLCRVRIDMPNDLDALWKIDVKKASAQPPPVIRERLRAIIDQLGASSKRIYTVRGHRLASDNRIPVWIRKQQEGNVSYVINTQHPVVEKLRSDLSPELNVSLAAALKLVEASIPLDAIFADMGSTPDQVGNTGVDVQTLAALATTTIGALRQRGFADEDIEDMLHTAEPFKSNWGLTQSLLRQ